MTERRDKPTHDAGELGSDGPPMPPEADGSQAGPPPKSPSFSRQAAQLVVIPALIVLVAVGVIYPIAKMASTESVEDLLAILRRSDGLRNDQWQAAYRLATFIPSLKDPSQQRSLNLQLNKILVESPPEGEGQLHRYLILAIAAINSAQLESGIAALQSIAIAGQKIGPAAVDELVTRPGLAAPRIAELADLARKRQESIEWVVRKLDSGAADDADSARPDNLEVIAGYAQSEQVLIRNAVAQGLWQWHRAEARKGIGVLLRLVVDDDPQVRGIAARALGNCGKPGDLAVLTALRQARAMGSSDHREASWDAAIALAKLDDEVGSRVVSDLLLNRSALAQLPDEPGGGGSPAGMTIHRQDRIVMSTLSATPDMTSRLVWNKIKQLADKDPNRQVRLTASQLAYRHEQGEPE